MRGVLRFATTICLINLLGNAVACQPVGMSDPQSPKYLTGHEDDIVFRMFPVPSDVEGELQFRVLINNLGDAAVLMHKAQPLIFGSGSVKIEGEPFAGDSWGGGAEYLYLGMKYYSLLQPITDLSEACQCNTIVKMCSFDADLSRYGPEAKFDISFSYLVTVGVEDPETGKITFRSEKRGCGYSGTLGEMQAEIDGPVQAPLPECTLDSHR